MATFSVETDLAAPYKYHWKKNGAFIAGAPSGKTYTTPPLREEDLKAKFSVMVFGQASMEESESVSIKEEPVGAKGEEKDLDVTL